MNGQTVKEKVIRVSWYRKNFGSGDQKDANLYIKDIPQSVTHADLNEKFAQFGTILSCSLPMNDDTKQHKGFGYIQFEKAEQAKAAIDSLHESEWNGNKIYVSILIPQNQREAGQIIKNNLFITGFNENMTEESLKQIFEKFGPVSSVSIPDTKAGKGYVCFKEQGDAEKAKEDLNGTTPQGSLGTLQVFFHQKKNSRTLREQQTITNLTKNLFVKGFDAGTEISALEEFFKKFGAIESSSMGKNGRYAYICFKDSETASKAIYEATLNNPFGKNFSVDYFQPKDYRKKQQKDIEQTMQQKQMELIMGGMMNMM